MTEIRKSKNELANEHLESHRECGCICTTGGQGASADFVIDCNFNYSILGKPAQPPHCFQNGATVTWPSGGDYDGDTAYHIALSLHGADNLIYACMQRHITQGWDSPHPKSTQALEALDTPPASPHSSTRSAWNECPSKKVRHALPCP